ncbi:hypothetical protein [Acaryochloris sp. IP29b_bin.137]|nr:hypothetical protein [Acaryochloris sp. IP29b_bin.137]
MAYNDSSLPAPSLDKRLQIAAQHHLALEIANSPTMATRSQDVVHT